MLTIGALSQATGVKIPTIRYYEAAGLMPPPTRSGGNQRRYEQADLERLSFIRHARDLGFALDDIRALLELEDQPHDAGCPAADIARGQLAAVRAKIARLKRLERELARIATGCGLDGDRCDVLAALSDHHQCEGPH